MNASYKFIAFYLSHCATMTVIVVNATSAITVAPAAMSQFLMRLSLESTCSVDLIVGICPAIITVFVGINTLVDAAIRIELVTSIIPVMDKYNSNINISPGF